MNEPAELTVRVTNVDTSTGLSRQTVATARGVLPDGQAVTFAGEPRLLADFAAALEAGEEPVAIVPRWAVLWIGAEARA